MKAVCWSTINTYVWVRVWIYTIILLICVIPNIQYRYNKFCGTKTQGHTLLVRLQKYHEPLGPLNKPWQTWTPAAAAREWSWRYGDMTEKALRSTELTTLLQAVLLALVGFGVRTVRAQMFAFCEFARFQYYDDLMILRDQNLTWILACNILKSFQSTKNSDSPPPGSFTNGQHGSLAFPQGLQHQKKASPATNIGRYFCSVPPWPKRPNLHR